MLDLDLLNLSPRNSSHIESLYHLTREGLLKGALPAYHMQQQATSKFFLAALILSEPVLDTLRRELRRVSPDVKVQNEEIRAVLMSDVLKREVVEGEKADEARKKIQKAAAKALRAKKPKETISAVDNLDDSEESKADSLSESKDAE